MAGGYRQGNRQQKRRARSLLGPQVHVALQAVHSFVNHRESHAPSGQVVDGGEVEKPGRKMARSNSSAECRARLGLGKHLVHFLQIHSPAVVFYFDNEASSLGIQTQGQRSHRRFSRAGALRGCFNSMTDGVAQQMHHRILQGLEYDPVRPDTGPAQPEVDFLVLFPRQVPHHLSKAFKQVFRREPCGRSIRPVGVVPPNAACSRRCVVAADEPPSTGRPGSAPFVRRIRCAGLPRNTPADSPGATKGAVEALRNRTHSAAISPI